LRRFISGISTNNLHKVKQFVQTNKNHMMDEYTSFVSIPDVSNDSANIPLNTAFIQKMMEQRGIKSELLHGTTPGVNAAVYGEIKVAGAKRTVAFLCALRWSAGECKAMGKRVTAI
jgi:hypothetical protein